MNVKNAPGTLIAAVVALAAGVGFGAAAMDVIDDTPNDCYVITAYDTSTPSLEYWEVKVDKLSGCLYSFVDLTDAGDGLGGHTNYMGPSGYNRQCSLLTFEGRGGRVLTRKLPVTDLDDRLTFTTASDGSSFTITYREDAQSTGFFHNAYGADLYPGDLLTTITVTVLPPNGDGTVWTWLIEGENVSGRTLLSKIWAQESAYSYVEDDVTKSLDSDDTLADGPWDAQNPASYFRWTVGSNSLGLTVGREFILDYQNGLTGESNGGSVSNAAWAGFDYGVYGAAYSYSGADLPDGQVRTNAGQFIINIAAEAENVPPSADAGADQQITDSDGDGYAAVTLDASASVDSDGTIESWIWSENAVQIATGACPQVSLAVGMHTISLTVTDDGQATDSDEVTINVLPAFEQKIIELHPEVYGDDAYATSAECISVNNIMYFPYRNTDRMAFMRFPCRIPEGAEVVSAYLKVHASGDGDGTASTIRLQKLDFDDCPDLSSPNPYTYAVEQDYVDWTLPTDWTGDTWYTSPDLGDIVQSFLDGANYEFGSALGLRGHWTAGSYKAIHQWDYADHRCAPILEVAYTGGVAMIDLLMADPEVRIGQKIFCRTYNINAFDTLEARLDGELIFSKLGSQVQPEEMFVADYSNFSAGTHTLAVRVIGPDQSVRGEKIRTWTTLHDGIPHIGINVNNAICIDGTPFLPITSWILRNDRIPLISNAINTMLGVGWYPTNDLNCWQFYLNQAQANGMYMAGPGSYEGIVGTHLIESDYTTAADYINSTKTHPSLLAWFWYDEPDMFEDNAPGVRQFHELTRQLDTNHPTWTNLIGYRLTHNDDGWPNERAQEYCYMYNDSIFGERKMVADIIGIDYYVHEYSTHYDFCNLSDYLVALDRIQEWNYNLTPASTFLQPCDEAGPDNPRLFGRVWSPPPTEEMMKNLIWLSLIHEAKIISYFHYFEWFDTRPNLSVMQEALTWIENLTQPILSAPENVTESVTITPATGYRVDILPRRYDGDLYIFSGEVRDWGDPVYCQPDPEDITTAYFNVPQGSFTARIEVSGLLDDTVVTVYGENRTITSEAGYFEDTFDVHDVHIYVIPDAGGTESPLAGDANGDGSVDIADFVILKSHYGTATGAGVDQGDFNGDGDVDIADFVILKNHYGQTK